MKCERQNGFTILELLIVIVMILVLALTATLTTANCWFTEAGVLRKIQMQNQNVVKIIDVDRRIVSYSRFVVVDKNGERWLYELDSNILCNYHVWPARAID